MAQQEQRRQPILIDGKNNFTHCFQSIQHLQLNFKTYTIRNFMYTKHNGDQTNTTNTTNQTNTTQTTKITASTWVSTPTQISPTPTQLFSYNWDSANSGVFIFKFQSIWKNSYSTNFVHAIHHQFVHFIIPENPVRGLMNNSVHFIHPYMNPLPFLMADCQYSFCVFRLKKSRRRQR